MYNPRRPESKTSQIDCGRVPSLKVTARKGFDSFTGGKEKAMAKTVCKLLGIVFIIVGVAGFLAPKLLGAHLNPAHNAVHLVSGAIALYFGFAGSASAARGFCILFGLVYLLLGVCGWFLGAGPDHMLNVSTLLMLGTVDHIIHVLLGVVFLAGGVLGARSS